STEEHVLPYPIGKSYLVSQGNLSPWSHSPSNYNGVFRYAYDFDMPVGTILTATRPGVVTYIEQSYQDGDIQFGHENVLAIRHDDGSYSRYIHIKHKSALVSEGQTVERGDTIVLSGNTGYTLNQPHLHFDVVKPTPGQFPDITSQSIFVSFKNSSAFPHDLKQGTSYMALNYKQP
ncbi:MAG: M23 family metallopeptidase, partial [Flammeovirgaceae bacterium]|nr:M23 family metallopeptidase [Flammeovirgaceae bacterium]